MSTTLSPGRGGPPPPTGAHSLLVARSERYRRLEAAAWVERALSRGSKVYYKGWLDDGPTPEQHWIAGPDGAPHVPEALASGQFEFLDYPAAFEKGQYTPEGIVKMWADEVERGREEGWPRVAMSHESVRMSLDESGRRELAAREAGLDRLAEVAPLDVLCQVTVPEEADSTLTGYVGTHHRGLVDGRWSSSTAGGRWQPRGEVDAAVEKRFAVALGAAVHDPALGHGVSDLHIDLSGLEFLDVACAGVIIRAARDAPPGRRLVLHDASTVQRRLVRALDRPDDLVLDDEDGSAGDGR